MAVHGLIIKQWFSTRSDSVILTHWGHLLMFRDILLGAENGGWGGDQKPREAMGKEPAGRMNLHALLREGSVYASGEKMHKMLQTWNQLALINHFLALRRGRPRLQCRGRRCENEREDMGGGRLVNQDDVPLASVSLLFTNNRRWPVWYHRPYFHRSRN